MEFHTAGLPLDDSDVERCAERIGADAASLWAIITVETNGVGFFSSRKPEILYERRKFHALTGGKWDRDYPEISSSTQYSYGASGENQYRKLAIAYGLNAEAALKATSWGIGQVMGEHWSTLHYDSVEQFVERMCMSEGAQLDAVASFIHSQHLGGYLASQDWASFARRYNGPQFEAKHYDEKLRENYEKFKSGSPPDARVRAIQLMLKYRSVADNELDPEAIDGWLGRRTQGAIDAFLKTRDDATPDLDAVFASLRREFDAMAPVRLFT